MDETWFFIKKPLLSVEIFVSWGWKMKFLKNKTYLFARIASETHEDYISVVLFVSVGCALQGKIQLAKESWHDIVMVHHLMETAAQSARLASMLCPCFAHVVQSTPWERFRNHQPPFFLILILIFLRWGCWFALLFCFVCFSFSRFPGRCSYSVLFERFWIMLSFLCFTH